MAPRPCCWPCATNHSTQWLQQHWILCLSSRLGASSKARHGHAPAMASVFRAALLCQGVWLVCGPLLAARNPSPTLRKTVDHTNSISSRNHDSGRDRAATSKRPNFVHPSTQPRYSTLRRLELASSQLSNPCVSGTTPKAIAEHDRSCSSPRTGVTAARSTLQRLRHITRTVHLRI